MGNSASKAGSKAAAVAGRRQYPSTSSILNSATSTANAPSTTNATPQSAKTPSPSQVHPNIEQSPPTNTNAGHVELDGRDPQFGASLRKLGPAVSVERGTNSSSAFPTSSSPPLGQQGQNIFPSSDPSSNPSLMLMQARDRIAKEFEFQAENLGRRNFAGRSLVSAKDISDAIRMRDERGMDSAQVEKQMRFKSGILDQLGPRGMVANANA